MIDDYNINNLAKNQVTAVVHSRAIRRSVLPKLESFVWSRHVRVLRRDTNMAAVT